VAAYVNIKGILAHVAEISQRSTKSTSVPQQFTTVRVSTVCY